MNTKMTRFGPWTTTRIALFDSLGACTTALQTAPFSEAAGSNYVRLRKLQDELVDSIQAHSVIRLKEIDEEIQASGLIQRIKDASAEAKKEADRIKNATKTVNEIAAAVDKVVGVVKLLGQIVSL